MRVLQHPRSFRLAPHSFVLVVALAILLGKSQSCFIGSNASKLGYTYPSGDIVLLAGSPLELFCIINLEKAKEINCSVENLIFYKDTVPVDARYQTRVNETTIRLYIENQTESKDMYYCYLQRNQNIYDNQSNSLEQSMDRHPQSDLVCMNWVAVGTEPHEIETWDCISLNWQVLNCSWTVPKNYVRTTYSIKYAPKHRYSENVSCPNDDDIKYNFCTWTLRSQPMYRKNFDVLKIIINGTNQFKSIEQTFTYNHYSRIIMDPPKDLKWVSKNTTNVTLKWNIGDLQYFPKPLHYKIMYTYKKDTFDTTYCDTKNSTRNGSYVSCTIPGLICNSKYDFRVFMKSSLASDKYWSNFTSQVFSTSASHPAHAPYTDIGSFEIEPHGANQLLRTVYLHWQPLELWEKCGDNFAYNISAFEVSDDGGEFNATNIKLIETAGSYAKYEVRASKYRFEIRAVNKEGTGPGVSSVIVSSTAEKVEPVSWFKKTDYLGTSNCTYMYELSWEYPSNGQAIENYTIFWCNSDKERPHQCNGYLQWKTIMADKTKDNICINSSGLFHFAISANTNRSSSGMLWATCSVPHDHLGMVHEVSALTTGDTFIEVGWKLECADQASTIKGFAVTYCLLLEPNTTTCAPHSNYTVKWPSNNTTLLTSGNLTGLQPYSRYKVNICMYNSDREGTISRDVVLHTAEGAPNVKGMKLNLIDRTNTSVTIGWAPPHSMNGKLQYYAVSWNPQQQDLTVEKKTQVTISNLDPYTKYSVTVKACTSVCSLAVGPIEVSTRIGKPGNVENIVVKYPDQGFLVQWDPPKLLAGPHPFYEVLLLKDENVVQFSNRTNDTFMVLPKIDCNTNPNPKYEVSVRAVNIDDQRDSLEGVDPQPPVNYIGNQSYSYVLCKDSDTSSFLRILMCVTLPVLLFVFIGYGGQRLFVKCKDMKNVELIIPIKFQNPCGAKGDDPFEQNYNLAVSPKQADELSMLFDKTVEQSV